MKKIRVLIVDDSALIRSMLTEILQSDPQVEVVGAAHDPYDAREKIKKLNPDVLTLDVEMPKMDGVTFLRNLMRLRPMPVIMISSLTDKGADVTLQALEAGAIDFVSKPKIDVAHTFENYSEEILEKVKTAAGAKVQATGKKKASAGKEKYSADKIIQKSSPPTHFKTTDKLIAIGASTGGTEALRDVISEMPASSPGIVITQHIPVAFSAPFAERLNKNSQMTVCQATDGQQILPGHAYVAPGDRHLLVERSGARFVCHLVDGEPVNRHIPAVDVMFRSVAQNVGANAIAVLLTGMGADGAVGMKEMQVAGSPTIAQDERSSVVWGMPGEAVKLGAADDVLALSKIAERLQTLYKNLDITRQDKKVG